MARGVAMVAAVVLTAGVTGGPASANAASLPTVKSGARPGPDILYAPAVDAPQLQNAAPWTARPILVSGGEAYRGGEFLYQDFLYDDHGATGTQDPNDPFSEVEQLFSPKHGTLTYPTDPALANDAADLVELRVKPLASETAFRVTLNTLKAPDSVAFTVALGDSPVAKAWPDGAGVVSPAQLFLTVHGTTAVLTDATTGAKLAPAATATVDSARRQIDVRVPHAAWNPGSSVVRMAAGVGVWDAAAGSYAQPGPTATATQPGGAASSGAALFNMAFRTNEPIPKIYSPGVANTIAEGGALVKEDGSWWRERRQGDVLASGDVSEFSAEVDFSKLARRVDDESAVPRTGHIDRIFASQSEFGPGVDYNVKCLTSMAGLCTGRYLGRLQPYGLYVPSKPLPAKGFGLVISMHGLSANYNEFLGSHEAEQLGDRGTGSILASPESRGPDGSYKGYAEADVFEMWADVARHYKLNPELTDVTGYSMGGAGTYALASRWPDLWGRAFPIVGPPTSAASFTSLRNIPVLAWYGQTDELVGPEMSEQAFLNAQQAGIRYDHWVFTPAGHVTEGNNDEYGPAASFLGDSTVDRDPAHVTYVVDPSLDTKADSPTNHAYWLSGLTTRAAGSAGNVDVVSRAFGVGDPPALPVALSAGTLNGGSHGPLPYQRRTLDWGPAPAIPKADQLDVTVTNLSSVTIDAPRAGVSCNPKINLTSDGPTQVLIGGCPALPLPSNRACIDRRKFTFKLHHARRARVVAVKVFVNGKRRANRRGHDIKQVTLRRLPRRKFKVKIVATQSGGSALISTRTYRGCTKSRPTTRGRHHRRG
jgi:pimeloyl-ACP methyl ester carboxylesterase